MRNIILIILLLPTLAFAQRAVIPPNHQFNFAEDGQAKVVAVEPIYEDVVIGKNCQDPDESSSSKEKQCVPVLQQKATANRYVAEYEGHKITGATFRTLRVGDSVHVKVITTITPTE